LGNGQSGWTSQADGLGRGRNSRGPEKGPKSRPARRANTSPYWVSDGLGKLEGSVRANTVHGGGASPPCMGKQVKGCDYANDSNSNYPLKVSCPCKVANIAWAVIQVWSTMRRILPELPRWSLFSSSV
jgi:hypothetical protein